MNLFSDGAASSAAKFSITELNRIDGHQGMLRRTVPVFPLASW